MPDEEQPLRHGGAMAGTARRDAGCEQMALVVSGGDAGRIGLGKQPVSELGCLGGRQRNCEHLAILTSDHNSERHRLAGAHRRRNPEPLASCVLVCELDRDRPLVLCLLESIQERMGELARLVPAKERLQLARAAFIATPQPQDELLWHESLGHPDAEAEASPAFGADLIHGDSGFCTRRATGLPG